MIELRKKITAKLRAIHPRVYFQDAPDSAQTPYIVYDLPNSYTNEEQEIVALDVNVWDIGVDTTAIETITSAVWNHLHKYRYIDGDIQFSIYRSNRLPPIDEDRNILRRMMIFEVRYFDRRI